MNDQLQRPYSRNRDRSVEMLRLRTQSQLSPPTCAVCGSRNVRPFSTIYGRGTTFYTRIKGIILKHGYERTKRQSVLANKCSPPMKLPWSPSVLVLLLYLGARWGANKWFHFSYLFELAEYYLGWGSLLLAMAAGVNNFGFFPQRMSAWGRSYFCERCGSCTTLER